MVRLLGKRLYNHDTTKKDARAGKQGEANPVRTSIFYQLQLPVVIVCQIVERYDRVFPTLKVGKSGAQSRAIEPVVSCMMRGLTLTIDDLGSLSCTMGFQGARRRIGKKINR